MAFHLTPSVFLLICSFVYFSTKLFKKNSRPPLPPGPPGLPLIGNALQLPTHHEWLTFAEWGKIFGGIIHVSAFGQVIIILNSVEAIHDLFETRSRLYSDRPKLPMAGELVGYEDSLPLCPYGNKHRQYRKLMRGGLAQSKVAETFPIQEQKIRDFLNNLFKSPENFRLHVRNVVAAIVFHVSHGYTVSGEEDPLVALAEQATHEFSLASAPGAFLVDMLPILKHLPDWFPGAGFKKTANLWRKTAVRLKDEPYQQVKQQVVRGLSTRSLLILCATSVTSFQAQGTALPSFTSSLIENHPNPTPNEEDIFKWASTGFYSGGADTTVSAISSFFLAMLLYPDVQRKAREELDLIVGPNRLPKFSDREKLPYIEAVVKEVLRWNPVAPLALPHRLIQDDVYEGYFIPAGSILFANTWSIFRDPELFPAPEEFNPERYIQSTEFPSATLDPRSFAFGYGRRVCPGQLLADSSLYLTIVSTLSLFEITNAVNTSTGCPIVPVPNYKPGVICHPDRFDCLIKPRFPDANILAKLQST